MKPPPKIFVTQHAVERARYRFNRPALGWQDVHADVRLALAANRVAKRIPGATWRSRNGARAVWTPAVARAYIVVRRRDPKPPHGACWIVVTALETDPPKEAKAA